MWYWSVAILFWQLSIDHIVNGQCKRSVFAKTRLGHPSLPFDSLPYPTRTICRRVRTYVRSVSHVTTKRKEVDHIPWVWGSVPRALRARGSPAIKHSTMPYYDSLVWTSLTVKSAIRSPLCWWVISSVVLFRTAIWCCGFSFYRGHPCLWIF